MNNCVVDASVWVSYFLANDRHHALAEGWLDGQLRRRVCVPALLLSEVAGAIARQTGDRPLAHSVREALLRLPRLEIVPVSIQLGATAATIAVDLGMRGEDATYVALAHVRGLPLATFDQQQHERAKMVVETVKPEG